MKIEYKPDFALDCHLAEAKWQYLIALSDKYKEYNIDWKAEIESLKADFEASI